METSKPKSPWYSRCNVALGFAANIAQLWPIISIGVATVVSVGVGLLAYAVERFSISISICIGLFACGCLTWLVANFRDAMRKRQVLSAVDRPMPVASTVADANMSVQRLAAAKAEIKRLAARVKTLDFGPSISVSVPGNDRSISLAPPEWQVETKNSLRAIAKQETFDKYESVLKTKDPENGAVAFLNALAATLSIGQLVD